LLNQEEEIKSLIIFYEIIDAVLFIISLIFPFFFADIIEIIICGPLDIFILKKLIKNDNIGIRAVVPFFLELLHILEILVFGLEIFGVVSLIPFWYIFFIYYENEYIGERKEIQAPTHGKGDILKKIRSYNFPLKTEEESTVEPIYCDYCGAFKTSPDMIFCEKCGTKFD